MLPANRALFVWAYCLSTSEREEKLNEFNLLANLIIGIDFYTALGVNFKKQAPKSDIG